MPTEFKTVTVAKGVDLKIDLRWTPILLHIRDLRTGNALEWAKGMPTASGLFTNAATGKTTKVDSLGVHTQGVTLTVGQLEGVNSASEDGHTLSIRSVSEPEKKENILSLF